ncbi:MAG: hypothetical protein ACE37B_09640 [Ilumatobacter sp.]|uniref:hypothetical protein n=1 Tax=Ilumatobacter sp. TaxID=1967498 RepID=UPI0039192C3A
MPWSWLFLQYVQAWPIRHINKVSACLRSLQRAGLELSANSAEHPTTIRRLLHVAANIPRLA